MFLFSGASMRSSLESGRWWPWAVLAACLLPFANGPDSRWFVPWIAFLALVWFVRAAPLRVAIPGSVVLLGLASAFHARGALPLSGLPYLLAAFGIGSTVVPPFLLDRFASRRLGPLLGSLVLPASWVVLEGLGAAFSPFGSWGALGYTQREVLPLLQLASVAGVHGLSFLVLWFASTCASALREEISPRERLLRLGGIATVLLGIVVLGSLRLAGSGPAPKVLAALVLPRIQTYLGAVTGPNGPLGYAITQTGKRRAVTGEARESFRLRSEALATELLERSAQAARDGARLIVWSEGALMLAEEDEAAFVERAGNLASREKLHLAVSYLRLSLDGSGRIENLNRLLDPDGRTLWRYLKAHPVPGLEKCVRGSGKIPFAQTPAGRLAPAICFDLDFPRFVRRAAGADILIAPSDDWREIAPTHARMAAVRAVELGVSLVRPSSAGISQGIDPYGRVLGSLDYFESSDRTLVLELPAARVATLSPRLGDSLVIASGLVLLVLLAMASKTEPGLRGRS